MAKAALAVSVKGDLPKAALTVSVKGDFLKKRRKEGNCGLFGVN